MTLPKIAFVTYLPNANGLLRNIGDRVILVGVKSLVLEAIGPYHCIEIDADGAPIDIAGLDAVVFCGTPQISKFTKPQPIHKKMMSILGKTDIPVLNIGAGSFHFNNETCEEFSDSLSKGETADVYKLYSKFDLLTVRDASALNALERIGVKAELLACPGFFSTTNFKRIPRNLKFISPLGFTSTYWDKFNGDIFKFFQEIKSEFCEFKFIAHDQSDVELLDALGFEYLKPLREEDFLALMARCSELLTFRVHSALPAQAFGAKVLLAGFDNRIMMAQETGVNLPYIDLFGIETASDLKEKFENISSDFESDTKSLEKAMDSYKSKLKTALAPALERANRKDTRISEKLKIPHQFFFTQSPEFDIPLVRLLTNTTKTSTTDDSFSIETINSGVFAFGPYIRIPVGEYELNTTIFITKTVPENARIELVVRYTTGREIAREEALLDEDSYKINIRCKFNHEVQTPKIEFQYLLIFSGPTDGSSIAIKSLHLKRT